MPVTVTFITLILIIHTLCTKLTIYIAMNLILTYYYYGMF